MDSKKILIISTHADDETFGMGGTLYNFSSSLKYQLYWLIVTSIWEPKWNKELINSRETAIQQIAKIINFKEVIRWHYKDNYLDTIPINELQEKMINLLDNIKPNVIFTPSPWDFNFEHRICFDLIQMSTKLFYSSYITDIIAYEIPSSTEASYPSFSKFNVNLYYKIEDFIENKIELIKKYESELHPFPHPRSIEYINALAQVRGAESGCKYAEGFHIFRKVVK